MNDVEKRSQQNLIRLHANLRLVVHEIMKNKNISFSHSVEQCNTYPETYKFVKGDLEVSLETIAKMEIELNKPLIHVLLP